MISNTNANLKNTDTTGGTEPSIALNPANSLDIVILGFSGGWGTKAPLWYSTDGGSTWTEEFTIPHPPCPPGAPATRRRTTAATGRCTPPS